MYFMSDPQALHVTRNVIPGKLGVDLHLHRVHIPLVISTLITNIIMKKLLSTSTDDITENAMLEERQIYVTAMYILIIAKSQKHIAENFSSTKKRDV